jgi:hypothetical protein
MVDLDTPSMHVLNALEDHGLHPLDHQLYDVIDPDALDKLVASTGPDTQITFTVEQYRVTVTGDSQIDIQPM